MADIYQVAQRHAQEVARRERQALALRQRGWTAAWQRVERELAAFLERIDAALAAAGYAGATPEAKAAFLAEVHPSWAYQAGRLVLVAEAVRRELHGLYGPLVSSAAREQRRMVTLARQHVAEALGIVVPKPARGRIVSPERAATERLIGFLADGSPLRDLLDRLPDRGGQRVADVLVSGVAMGKNPRELAREARDAFQGNQVRALTVARTEVLRAYRAATAETLSANERLVDGWIWLAKVNAPAGDLPCVVCFAMHGTRHPAAEPLISHPRCRCGMMPAPRSWAALGIAGVAEPVGPVEPGSAVFARLPAAAQRRILGAGKYALYAAGDLALRSVVVRVQDPRWGAAWTERTLGEIRRARHATTLAH